MKENIDLRESFRNRRRIHWKTDYRRWNSAHFINLLEHLPRFQWGNFLEQKNPWPLFNLLGGALQGASYDVTVSLYFPSNICQMLNGDLGISQCPRNCSVHGACPYVVNLSTHSHVCEKMCTFFRQTISSKRSICHFNFSHINPSTLPKISYLRGDEEKFRRCWNYMQRNHLITYWKNVSNWVWKAW